MTRSLASIFSVLFFLFLPGCGGATEDPAASSPSKLANNNGGSANTTAGTTAADTNAAPANSMPENPLTAAKNKKIEAMRQAGSDPNVPKPDIDKILKQSTRPAPENSEFSFAFTDTLIERRTFLKHPVLARVEKTTDGPKEQIRVFLKDGRVVDLPGSAIRSISVAASASILKAAGIDAPASQPREMKPGAPARNQQSN